MANVQLELPGFDNDNWSKLEALLAAAEQDVNQFLADPSVCYVTPQYLAFITAFAAYCGKEVRDMDISGIRFMPEIEED